MKIPFLILCCAITISSVIGDELDDAFHEILRNAESEGSNYNQFQRRFAGLAQQEIHDVAEVSEIENSAATAIIPTVIQDKEDSVIESITTPSEHSSSSSNPTTTSMSKGNYKEFVDKVTTAQTSKSLKTPSPGINLVPEIDISGTAAPLQPQQSYNTDSSIFRKEDSVISGNDEEAQELTNNAAVIAMIVTGFALVGIALYVNHQNTKRRLDSKNGQEMLQSLLSSSSPEV